MKHFRKNNTGFTLIELMVTIAIAGVVLGIAIPSFNDAIRNSRLTTTANKLTATLNLAKSEAIKRGVQVTVRRKGATSKHWEQGWDVFVDSDGNNSFSDATPSTPCEMNADGSPKEDCLLKTYGPLPAGLTLITGASTYKDYAAYLPTGISKGGAGDTFHLCQASDVPSSKEIILNAVGRAYVKSPGISCT